LFIAFDWILFTRITHMTTDQDRPIVSLLSDVQHRSAALLH